MIPHVIPVQGRPDPQGYGVAPPGYGDSTSTNYGARPEADLGNLAGALAR